jgi:hypothetical protein
MVIANPDISGILLFGLLSSRHNKTKLGIGYLSCVLHRDNHLNEKSYLITVCLDLSKVSR